MTALSLWPQVITVFEALYAAHLFLLFGRAYIIAAVIHVWRRSPVSSSSGLRSTIFYFGWHLFGAKVSPVVLDAQNPSIFFHNA